MVSFGYSSVGLGGGTAYTALLAIFGLGHRMIPPISLSLNVTVTLLASLNYARKGYARPRLIMPFVATSMPMAYLGGTIDVGEKVFQALLIGLLMVVAGRIYFWPRPVVKWEPGLVPGLMAALLIGALLGLISGMVGIGGGILLVPVIILLGLASPREAAATGAVFIVLNSLSGLAAHLPRREVALSEILVFLIPVIVGGFLGSYLGSTRFVPRTIQRILGLILLVAIVLLGWRFLR